jgi:membrane protein YdbS with pleckstrin-like domain
MVYHSKKDWWLLALVRVCVLLPIAIGIYNLVAEGGNARAGWTLLFICALTGALILFLTYPLYYEVTASNLIVRCGLLVRKEIPLSSIVEAHSTRSPLSAPAWSLDRLHIDYRRDGGVSSVLISPEDKLRFMRELAASGAGLEVRNERVVRTQ